MSRNYRQFYALLKQLPGAEKEDIVHNFTRGRTKSLQAMYNWEFDAACACMSGQARVNRHCQDAKFDTWRKRVIAAIGGYLELSGGINNIENIKAIASRAAGRKWFNDVTISELRAIYNEFLNKQKVAKRSMQVQ